MDKDELEEVEDSELNDNQEEEQSSSGISESSNNEVQEEEPSASPQKASSLINDLVMLWKKIPISVKGTILTCLGYVGIFVAVAILILLLGAAATGVSEDLWENIANLNDSISIVGEKVGNFFTGEGFVTNQEEAEKYEKKYYEKLKQVADYYQRKLRVQIDTSMITATLFYGRGMSDYIDDDINKHEDGLFSNDESDSDIYQGEADFYKLARRQIKTLAKFQIVESTALNTCPDTVSAPQSKTTPESNKEIADTWAGFDSWNTRAKFAYLPYSKVSYPTIEGASREITWCEYKNAENFLRQPYVEDYKIYNDYLNKYNSCVIECKNLNGTQTWDPHTREWVTNTCNPETACSSQKEKEQDYLSRLQNSWGDVFSVGDTPSENASFQCAHSSTWGTLSKYDSNSLNAYGVIERNYKFPEEWINRSEEPDFWATTLALFTGEMEKIDCSAKPSISTSYSIDISEEGVYYFKLMSRKSSLLSNKSFIEKYYPDYITATDDEAQLEEELTEVVDGIFDLYKFIVNRSGRYCFTPSTSSGSYSSPDRAEFISMIADEVVKDMQNTGILASVTIAQAAHESANGTSKLSQPPYNNYYGMTAGSCASGVTGVSNGEVVKSSANGNNCTGNAYWNGDVVRMCNKAGADCQWYRVYDGFSNSTLDHSRLLSTSRYSCQGITDSAQTVNCIQNAGYATDPNYFNAIMNTIATYDLEQYNIGEWNGEAVSEYGSALTGTICYGGTDEIINGDGTIAGNGAQGIRIQLWGTPEYETFWGGNNNLFYRSNPGLVEQCTWYAHGRGLEILTKNGMSLKTAQQYMDVMHGNAGTWYNSNKYFSSSVDYTKPKVGAIIVWSKGSEPGHVAIIEDIQYDAHGNVTSITTTEGGKSIGGFRHKEGRPLDWVKGHGAYKFVGYVYLLN